MKRKLIKNISANTIQLIINQVFGLMIFYMISNALSKDNFGKVNLVLAILHTSFNILSCGIDQVAVKKIVSGKDPGTILSIYIGHVVIAGLLFYSLLISTYLLFPNTPLPFLLLIFIGIGKLMIFFSSPFKQASMGLERFNLFAYMSVASNVIRGLALIILALFSTISLSLIIIIFICGDFIELMLCIYLCKYRLQIPIKLKWDKKKYFDLIKESFPQVGVVLFTSAIARFDWIFIGLFLSAVKLAEYSFAWKAFEMSTLPLLAVAPLLLPLFIRLFSENKDHPTEKLYHLLRFEMIIASLVALLLNLCWSPIIDMITYGKYGFVNANTIFILSLCMPLLYFNNFLWSIYFAKGKLKFILLVIAVTFFVNFTGDILMIPYLKNEGAALSYFIAMLIQFILYTSKIDLKQFRNMIYSLVFCFASALGSGLLANFAFVNPIHIFISAVLFHFIFLFATAQLRLNDFQRIKQLSDF
ncbi:MAG TPA: hypothetical protein DIT07_01380 [Sphingobacteriaceae bacterium]|nr:hypothetical protein [Sphingobacteriaceae bacterium]